jgi:hypothetical protein
MAKRIGDKPKKTYRNGFHPADEHPDKPGVDPNAEDTPAIRKSRIPEGEAMVMREDGVIVPWRPKGPGASRIVLTEEEVIKLRAWITVGCSVPDCAAMLGVSKDILLTRYREVIESTRVERNAALRRVQYDMAFKDKNATMVIWLGKQWLGQSDAVKIGEDPDNPFGVAQFGSARPIMHIHFVESNGDGSIGEEEQQRIDAEVKTIDAQIDLGADNV